jgi:hypothetical protein
LFIVNSPEHVLLLSPFLLKGLERVFEYDRVRSATSIGDDFSGTGARIIPSDADDDPFIPPWLVKPKILCTLNRDFYHASVLEYCKDRGVLAGAT